MKVSVDTRRQIIVLIVSLLVSIIFSFIPYWTGILLTTLEQLLLTVALFIAFLLSDIMWILSGMK